jgi:hypothetical protein
MGYKDADAQLLSTPPYILAMFITLVFAYISDKKGIRGPCILVTEALAIIGFAVLLAAKNAKYRYVGTFFACTGVYSTVPVLVSWASNNTGGDIKKGVRIALMVGLGNLGGICSSFIYRYLHFLLHSIIISFNLKTLMSICPYIQRNQDQKTGYKLGHRVMISTLCMSWAATCIAIYTFRRLNREKEERCRREHIDASRTREFVDQGDHSPLFRYSI